MADQNKQQFRDNLNKMRSDIDRSLEDAKNVRQQMTTFNADEALKLGLDTVQKSLEHSKAIIDHTERQWEREFAGSGGAGVR